MAELATSSPAPSEQFKLFFFIFVSRLHSTRMIITASNERDFIECFNEFDMSVSAHVKESFCFCGRI